LTKRRSRAALWRELGWAGVVLGLAALLALFAPGPGGEGGGQAGADLPQVSAASR
jgi:hypothetical protein